nr:MAG TPA: hypothetical protein [Caudoviricetes sp.]
MYYLACLHITTLLVICQVLFVVFFLCIQAAQSIKLALS